MTNSVQSIQLEKVLEFSLEQQLGQLRAIPVRAGRSEPTFLAVYAADFDVDPSVNMFFYPTDTLKMALFNASGEILWKRELGKTVVPGIWFCPVYAFDLDGDGVDEIWYVNNLNEQHPFALPFYRLERLDAQTGLTTGQWEWPNDGGKAEPLSCSFRHFIVGGYAHGEPVLVTAQGTYQNLRLQGWKPDMTLRWEHYIGKDDPGARGSHITPVIDLNGDGVDELLWGERCISLDTGKELFCADRDVYRGHSDVIQPVLDNRTGKWSVFTVRESDPDATPRVVMFDDQGERLWGDVDHGHMDIGWAARLQDDRSHVMMAIRIGAKTCGPDGRFHQNMDEFVYDAATGTPYTLPFSVYRTIPVDLNGDGYHELVRGMPAGDGEVFDRHGVSFGNVGGTVAMASKFLDLPGEQILSFRLDGTVMMWADKNAVDSPEAQARYSHPYYKACQRLYAIGYNLYIVAGL
ncbi:polysaccharide lyase 11 [Paenibacillus thalictri]|uniref:Polysaccharide lyase 11 n=1 Tax=Paenibacillus thalictri TaxID=2527873 RepID=A0A4V2J3Y0_9BACL|nr:polysaccharide lyase 11 [Paenibacillus thalictri]TBL76240.1 polysaccharide lyase 11 [Paenibacillus thalictri]